MRPNSAYYQDLSEMRYVEVVARGNVGSLYLDLGLLSEDVSINGYAPNDNFDGENTLGTTTAFRSGEHLRLRGQLHREDSQARHLCGLGKVHRLRRLHREVPLQERA